jgi:hypothetical protein
MTLDDLYARAAGDGVSVYDFRMRETRAMSLPSGHVALDRRRLGGSRAEKAALAHELGHVERGAFYNVLTPLETRERCEYKANKRSFEILVPRAELRAVMESGMTEPYELAEYFDVPEPFICRCLDYYHDVPEDN